MLFKTSSWDLRFVAWLLSTLTWRYGLLLGRLLCSVPCLSAWGRSFCWEQIVATQVMLQGDMALGPKLEGFQTNCGVLLPFSSRELVSCYAR